MATAHDAESQPANHDHDLNLDRQLDTLLDGCPRGRQHLFTALNRVQDALGWVPPAAHARVARRLGVPRHEVGAVTSFYPHYRRTPPPRLNVQVCCDMACHLRGAGDVLAAAQALAAGGTDIEVGTVSCLGQCDRPTAVAVNGHILPNVTPERLAELTGDDHLATRATGHAVPIVDEDDEDPAGFVDRATPADPPSPDTHSRAGSGAEARFALPHARRHYHADPYDGRAEYRALRDLLASRDFEHAVSLVDASGLRGLGGAAFPTGRKWSLVRATERTPKWTICNADESEPGTIKDRLILEELPELVIEGIIIGGLCVGSDRGVIYLRHEYHTARESLRAELARCREQGILGPNVLGSGLAFDLELFISPGGYICGEETALLEALEGKRAEPRNKPPFPGTHGLFGQPTLINSVETFAFVPTILLNGPDWWKRGGWGLGAGDWGTGAGRDNATPSSPNPQPPAPSPLGGLKFYALSGHVARPGVYELPMGVPADRFIAEAGGGVLGGRALKAFSPGGASSGFLPAALAGTPLDFDSVRQAGSMLGTGAVVVVAEGTCMLDLALNVVRFFRNESCGKCVPCGVGSQKLVELLERIAAGRATVAELGLIDELAAAMAAGSICGLGQAAPAPITSVLTHFRDEVVAHLTERRCPSGICPVARSG